MATQSEFCGNCHFSLPTSIKEFSICHRYPSPNELNESTNQLEPVPLLVKRVGWW